MSEIMRFDVMFSSHDLLRQGVTEAQRVRVSVAADSYAAGECLAAQFAMTLQAMRGRPEMPTATYPVI